jgi:hypothetical protein
VLAREWQCGTEEKGSQLLGYPSLITRRGRGGDGYCLRRRRTFAAIPAKPVPSRIIVVGSGTAAVVPALGVLNVKVSMPSKSIVLCLLKLISYSVILLIIAAATSRIPGKFKTQTLVLFSWLFLAAAVLDLGVAAYEKFVV